MFTNNSNKINNKFFNNIKDISKIILFISSTILLLNTNLNASELKDLDLKNQFSLSISFNQETLNNFKNISHSFNDILNNKTINNDDKIRLLNQIIEQSKDYEKLFDISLLDEPKSTSLQEQSKNILNSNLKKLGNSNDILNFLNYLNKKDKNLELYDDLESKAKDQIEIIINNYNNFVFTKNTNAINVTYGFNEPKEENVDTFGIFKDQNKIDFLNKSIISNNIESTIVNLSKENLQIFTENEKEQMLDYVNLLNIYKFAINNNLPETKLSYINTNLKLLEKPLIDNLIEQLSYYGINFAKNFNNDESKIKVLTNDSTLVLNDLSSNFIDN